MGGIILPKLGQAVEDVTDPVVIAARQRDEQRTLDAFNQGQASARKGGYRADNPHKWGTTLWEVWREGFAFNQDLPGRS